VVICRNHLERREISGQLGKALLCKYRDNRAKVMARAATTAFRPAPEHAAGFGPPHGFRFTFQTAPAKNSQTVIASHPDAREHAPDERLREATEL
jgi:hypothetical protein